MLIRFSVANYLSFKSPASINLIKSRERQLSAHVCGDTVSGFHLLRGAVIYGANASGKSNLVSAMNDAQQFVVDGKLIKSNRAFKLSKNSNQEPSTFEYEFTYDNQAYSYGFDILKSMVIEEYLYMISFKGSKKLIFKRTNSDNGSIIEAGVLFEKTKNLNSKAIDLLLKSVPNDVLLVTDLYQRQLKDELPKKLYKHLFAPYNWCRDQLIVLNLQDPTPPIELIEKMKRSENFRNGMNEILSRVDPGIKSVELRLLDHDLESFSSMLELGDGFKDFIQSVLEKDGRIIVPSTNNRRRYVINKNNGEFTIERMVIIRENEKGEDIEFELNEESEGTRRVIDLIPLFLRETKNTTLIIDEMERSLHPEVTRLFHDLHYNSSPCLNRQLIMVTHEHHLLSQNFYRRDEVWFTQKNNYGETDLYSLSDFDGVRFDKDIRKDYLLGRYGAIPNV